MEIKRFIFKKAVYQIDAEIEGYEMDCLISAEFTPAPDNHSVFTTIERLCTQTGITIKKYYEWLKSCSAKWRHPLTPPYFYWEIQAVIEDHIPNIKENVQNLLYMKEMSKNNPI